MLDKWDLLDCKPRYFPGDANQKLPPRATDAVDPRFHQSYRSKTGFLMHIATVSRPDLALCASMLSRYLSAPRKEHMDFADQVLRYVSTTRDKKLTYHCQRDPGTTTFASVDAAFADQEEYHSTFGWVIHVAGAAWSWRVSRTRIQTHSACESEYYAIDDLVREVMFVSRMYSDLKLRFPVPLTVLEDNMGAIFLTTGPSPHHQRTKHVGYRYHYVRSLVRLGKIRFQHQDTSEQPSDLLTKLLPQHAHEKHAAVLLGLQQIKIFQRPLPAVTRVYLKLHERQLRETKGALARAAAR